MINREEMQTLGGDTEVLNCIIDSWATLPNHKKSKDKIYFSTMPHVSLTCSLITYWMFILKQIKLILLLYVQQIICDNTVCGETSTEEIRFNSFKERIENEMKVYKIDSIVGYKQVKF